MFSRPTVSSSNTGRQPDDFRRQQQEQEAASSNSAAHTCLVRLTSYLGLFESGQERQVKSITRLTKLSTAPHRHRLASWTTVRHKKASPKQAIPRAAHPVPKSPVPLQSLRTCSTTTKHNPSCLPPAAVTKHLTTWTIPDLGLINRVPCKERPQS